MEQDRQGHSQVVEQEPQEPSLQVMEQAPQGSRTLTLSKSRGTKIPRTLQVLEQAPQSTSQIVEQEPQYLEVEEQEHEAHYKLWNKISSHEKICEQQ